MQKNAQGYVDPSVWDRGINAAFLSYNASAYKTFNKLQGVKKPPMPLLQ